MCRGMSHRITVEKKEEPAMLSDAPFTHPIGKTVDIKIPGEPVVRVHIYDHLIVRGTETAKRSYRYGVVGVASSPLYETYEYLFDRYAEDAKKAIEPTPEENHLCLSIEQIIAMKPCAKGLTKIARINGDKPWTTVYDIHELFAKDIITPSDAAFIAGKLGWEGSMSKSLSDFLRYEGKAK